MSNKARRVFNGKLLKVYTATKKLPNGYTAYFEEVKHPGAVLVVPFAGDRVVLLRQYRPVIDKYIWELPAGKLDPGESPAVCAKREMIEETGYSVRGLKRLGYIYTTPGFSDEIIYFFTAKCATHKGQRTEKDEMIEVSLIPPEKIRAMFHSGKIHDSKTIAALSFAGVL